MKSKSLRTIQKQGKDRKWRERKLKNIELAGRLENWVIVRLNGSINVQRF